MKILPSMQTNMVLSEAEALELLASTDELSKHAQVYMADAKAYKADLDELCRMTARFFVDKSGLKDRQT